MTPINKLVAFILLLLWYAPLEIAHANDNQLLSQAELNELLKEYKLSGVSVAVIDDFNVVYSATAGEKVFGSGDAINQSTAFSTASISKPVTALLAAMLEEQGKLSLDDSVAKYLTRWTLQKEQFPNPEEITFRRLLSHTAGTTQSGFADFYKGDAVPTAIDSLNGVNVPRYDSPISLAFKPGESWSYSGGGYVIVQIALEDLTGKTLPELAEEMLFKPLNMVNTTMYQPDSPLFLQNVASVHQDDLSVIQSGYPICPQIAPSGMWSNALDMATLIIEMQRALNGDDTKVISQAVARNTTQIETLDVVGGWGLGWMRLEAKGNLEWFSHGGSNTGTGGQIMGTMRDGRGIAIFGNGGNPARIPVIETVIATVVEKLDWKKSLPVVKQQVPLKLLNDFEGKYLAGFGETIEISKQNNQLFYQGRLLLWSHIESGELVYLGDGEFGVEGYPNRLSLETVSGKKRLKVSRKGSDKVSYFESAPE